MLNHPSKSTLTVLAFVVGVLIITLILLIPSLAPATPKITWTPSKVSEIVSPKEYKSVAVSFTSSENINDIAVWVVPELQSFLHVEPSKFSSVKAGVTVTITLIIAPAADSPLGTFDGTIHLKSTGKSSKTFAKPLSITLNIWQSVAEKGLIVHFPPEWQVNPGPLSLGGPISLNTFKNLYQQGGIIPEHGAEIDITTIPLPTSPLSDVIAKELKGAVIESTDSMFIAGHTATKVVYTDSFTPTLTYKNVSVYMPYGTLLYKFFISYRAGDPLETNFLASFQQILGTVQFTQ